MGRFQEGVWDAELHAARRRREQRPRLSPWALLAVVLAAVALVVGLYAADPSIFSLHGAATGNPSYQVIWTADGTAHVGGAYLVNLTFRVPSGLTTGITGLDLRSNGTALATGLVPGDCTGATPFATCLGLLQNLSGWVALLLTLGGDVLATYPVSPGSTEWSDPNVFFVDAGSLALVAPSTLASPSDTLEAFGTASPSVSGSVTL